MALTVAAELNSLADMFDHRNVLLNHGIKNDGAPTSKYARE
jgi:hypothetical protein